MQQFDRRRALLGAAAGVVALAGAPALAQQQAASTAGRRVAAAAQGPLPDLAGRSILITGTSSGFGRGMAELFAVQGATVVATMRNMAGGQRPEAQQLAAATRAARGRLHLVELDVTDPEQVRSAVAEGERLAGGALDVVVNNAGVAVAGPAELFDREGMRLTFATNVEGPHLVARATLPAMRAAGRGLIVNVSSQLGRLVMPMVGHYAASKWALEAMSEAMAYELAPLGVEVTIVQPGGYPTQIWATGGRLGEALLARQDAGRRQAYAQHLEIAARMFGGGGTTDPMDVPRAIARVVGQPPGARPLRLPVHPDTRATDALNAAAAEVQARALGQGPFADWHRAVATGAPLSPVS